jgi:16S rRNA G966 N2-methylase RsmD
MRTHLRIVAGSLRGRRFSFTADPALRPLPDMVRQALFNILGNAVPDRPFFDLFAGTGAVGLEALSRGASRVEFVERDPRVAREIFGNLQTFGVVGKAKVHRTDVYRWAQHWQAPPEQAPPEQAPPEQAPPEQAPPEPATLFLGPPFPEYEHRLEALLGLLGLLQRKAAPDSVLVLQSEKTFVPDKLPDVDRWEHRRYGRNQLSIWTKEL